jgi:hypothetical protein
MPQPTTLPRAPPNSRIRQEKERKVIVEERKMKNRGDVVEERKKCRRRNAK